MKLRRKWPAICIWAVFLIFDIVMVASLCFFLGLFPSDRAVIYSGILTVVSVLAMSVITLLLGKLSDSLGVVKMKDNVIFWIMYSVLILLVITAGVYYRMNLLANTTADITGKYSLYENAMIGGANVTPDNDLLSIIYSSILKAILFFTGNIVSVPFFFQTACFTIFMICGYLTVRKLLGMAAALVFTMYVAFMPVFTISFSGLELSTDSLFMAMFGIELLVMALFLRGAYKKIYKSWAFTLWYIFVGVVVGFMAYVDAGTIIMILPFMGAALFLYGTSTKKEIVRLVFVLFGAAVAFAGMIAQEQGLIMAHATLSKWSSYYFHNLNTFSMFWTYTDHKIIYLVTVVVMSGVMVGFWKNRNFENISPWLLSMLFIFATVPFMGATRMNTQVFVTIYYAFILACVASLITTPADEKGEEPFEIDDAVAAEQEENPAEEESEERVPEDRVVRPETAAEREPELEKELEEVPENESEPFYEFEDDTELEADLESEPEPETAAEPEPSSEPEEEPEPETAVEPETETVSESETETVTETAAEPETETASEPETETVSEPAAEPVAEPEPESLPEPELESEPASEPEPAPAPETETAQRQRFVPEGMVVPEDDEDADLTPRMKMPEYNGAMGFGKHEKLKIRSSAESQKQTAPKDDFDIQIKPGDDFDI